MTRESVGVVGALSGFLGVAGNILGVAVLGEIGAAYRPSSIPTWVQEIIAAPGSAAVSAAGFTLGLVALAGWAIVLGLRGETTTSRAAGLVIATGALLNAAWTPAPLVVALHLSPLCAAGMDCVPTSVSLLAMSLSLDALFNLLLGVGLVLFALSIWHRDVSERWVAALCLLAGVASLPVSLQFYSDRAAGLLAIAGPLWLLAVVVTSIQLWRGRL